MNQIPNIEEIRAYLTYKIPTNNGNALVAEPSPITIQKVQDLLLHQLQKAREEALREIIEVRNDRNKSTRELLDTIDRYQAELDQDKK